jgi:hypothetical protein
MLEVLNFSTNIKTSANPYYRTRTANTVLEYCSAFVVVTRQWICGYNTIYKIYIRTTIPINQRRTHLSLRQPVSIKNDLTNAIVVSIC